MLKPSLWDSSFRLIKLSLQFKRLITSSFAFSPIIRRLCLRRQSCCSKYVPSIIINNFRLLAFYIQSQIYLTTILLLSGATNLHRKFWPSGQHFLFLPFKWCRPIRTKSNLGLSALRRNKCFSLLSLTGTKVYLNCSWQWKIGNS